MASNPTQEARIPLMLIDGAWLSARSWENFAGYFEKRGFDVSAPEWPRKHGDVEELREATEEIVVGEGWEEIAEGIDSWLDGVLGATPAPAQGASA
jgi:hypothetical protein